MQEVEALKTIETNLKITQNQKQIFQKKKKKKKKKEKKKRNKKKKKKKKERLEEVFEIEMK